MVDNFSCSDYSLSHVDITEEEWTVQLLGPNHNSSITALAVCQVIISVIGTLWNAIVLTVILLKKKFKDPTYILLMNLIMTDLLVCTLVLPFNINSAFNREFSIGQSDHARCRFCQGIGIILMALLFISSFTLTFLSLDRLVYIKWPFKYQRYVSVKRTLILIAITWIFSVAVTLPPVFGLGEIEFVNTLGTCSPLTLGRSRFKDNIYYIIFLIVVGLCPFLMGLVANIWILKLACKYVNKNHQKRFNVARNGDVSNETDKENHTRLQHNNEKIHLARVFGALFVIDIVPWVPVVATPLIQALLENKDTLVIIYAVLYLSVVSLSAIHPVLETCLLGKARSVIYMSICCCFKKKK